jgi:transcriptional regulator with XRE-family HTH domain
MTQRQLAAQAGITQATLVDLEHGRGRPRVGTMQKVAAALGVEVTAIAEFKRAIEADDQLSAAA